MKITTKNTCQLYLITPPILDLLTFSETLKKTLNVGGIAAIQLRLKEVNERSICKAAEVLVPIAHSHNTKFIMNDHPELAKKTGCDGVHIGQKDATYQKARNILGKNAIIGVTCHDSRNLAIEASRKGADYVAFGAFFPTFTKKTSYTPDLEILKWWTETTTLPSVAIGGITTKNCCPLIESGANFLSVISGVWNHKNGPEKAIHEFNQCIKNYSEFKQ